MRPIRKPAPRRRTFLGSRCTAGILVLVGAFWTLPALADNAGAYAGARDEMFAPLPTSWSVSTAAHAAIGQEESAAQVQGYRWRGPMAAQPDREGLIRDTGFFLGLQFAVIGVLYVLPESVSGWSEEQKREYSASKWRENVTNPIWDKDRWWINYILHPYWGGAYYTRGRERGLGTNQSFWYSVLLSTLYEYGAEAFFEPVSIQDLIVTPIVGSLVGEYLFAPWRASIRAKPGELDWSDKTVLVLTDPLGVANAQMERWLGVKTAVTIQPIGMRQQSAGRDGLTAGMIGPLRRPAPAWGVQLRITW